MEQENNSGIVYVLSNPAMPGLVKIGKTARGSVHARLGELYSTGVPVPFECEFAGRVEDETKVEKAFHLAFGPYRINPKREFFQIEPEQAITLLKLMISEDVTPQLIIEAENVDKNAISASNKLKSQRQRQNFIEMGMEIGSQLDFSAFEAICYIFSETKVKYEDEIYSLTGLTKKLLETETALRPGQYWTYQGKKLIDIYNETYS